MKHGVATVAGVAALLLLSSAGVRAGTAADDTGRNVRDRAPGARTADQQSNDPQDMKLTQDIRHAVVADDSLSTNAHNVKIITIDGVVTLRGPVNSAAEKASIAAKAERVAGVKRVDNQLEITAR